MYVTLLAVVTSRNDLSDLLVKVKQEEKILKKPKTITTAAAK